MIDTRNTFAARRVLVVVPTYNNAQTLARVVEDVREYADDILIVNDGSTDQTGQIIQELDVEHISYQPNRGKGYAIKQAFRYAVERGFRYVLTIDSDGQHYASDLATFAHSIEQHPDSLIIGARNLKADNMPSKNTFANKFSNFWYRIETGKRLDDTQSGYRAYPVDRIGRSHFVSNRYEFEVEVIVRSAWRGVDVMNIPIHVYYPPESERVSHFKPVKDFTRISILNSFLVIVALLYYYPVKFLRSLTKENIKRFIEQNITNTHESNHRVSAAIALGVFFGIVPIWGYQMIVAGITAHLLRLNKVLTLLASNISIPPMIPLILYGSFYTGGILLGTNSELKLWDLTLTDIYDDLIQYIYGAMAFALVCSAVAYAVSRVTLQIFRRKTNG